jgi:hypothetical protein
MVEIVTVEIVRAVLYKQPCAVRGVRFARLSDFAV